MACNKRHCVVILMFLIVSTLYIEQIPTKSYWPTEEWKEISPQKANMNETIIREMINFIEDYNSDYYSRIDSSLIFKDGKLVSEWYHPLWDKDALHIMWSVTKSFTGTLIGIAIQEGFLSGVNSKMIDFFTNRTIQNLDSRKEIVTIDHLLMMSSGFNYKGDDIEFLPWMSSEDHISYILNKNMSTDPGSVFNYDTGGSHLLSAILQEATGMTMEEFAISYLFTPLGISNYYWETDNQGVTFGGHGLSLKPQDMAKLGYLYYNNGYWDGKQILPEDWVNFTTTTKWNLGTNWGYARQWWTHPVINCYSAKGKDGQMIFVLPEDNLVVVFTATISGSDPEPFLTIIQDYILDALLEPRSINYIAIIFPPIALVIIIITIVVATRFSNKN